MKVKTEILSGKALDWAVAMCVPNMLDLYYVDDCPVRLDEAPDGRKIWNPEKNWLQGGPIIEQDEIAIVPLAGEWEAQHEDAECCGIVSHGPTALIAAMRCFVASKLGEEVDVPDELLVD